MDIQFLIILEIKCLEKNGDITSLGCILAQLPVEPRFGRMMVLGNIFMLGDSLSTIAAGSSIDYDLFIEDNGNNSCSPVYIYIMVINIFKCV